LLQQDFTTYQVVQADPLKIKEFGTVDSKKCLFHGSTFVDSSLRKILASKLKSEHPGGVVRDCHLDLAMKVFNDFRKRDYRKDQGNKWWKIGTDDEFEDGEVLVQSSWVKAAFQPHVEAIIKATTAIAARDEPRVSATWVEARFLR
jgi:hypothetical protein